MITRNDAIQIAQERVASWKSSLDGDSLILIDSAMIEKNWGWVFFYTSRLWHETQDDHYLIAGNAPFIVERNTGRVLVPGTALPVEHYLDRYEKYGDPHFEPGSWIRLVRCVQAVHKMTATKLLRDNSGVGLLAAKQVVDACAAGQKPCAVTASPEIADKLARDLESVGFVIERLAKSNQNRNTS